MDQMAQTASDVPVHQVIVNRRFRPRRLWSWVGQAHNIALLQLRWALTFSKYVWPICLPDMEHVVKDRSLCTVTGWGLPKVNGESQPPQTRWVVWERAWAQAGACRGQTCLRHCSHQSPALPFLSGSHTQGLLPLEGFSGEHPMVIQALGDRD